MLRVGWWRAQADPEVAVRLEYLAERSTEGALSDEERAEYQALVSGIDFVAALQARARRIVNGTEVG